jgi:hypothetical protein
MEIIWRTFSSRFAIVLPPFLRKRDSGTITKKGGKQGRQAREAKKSKQRRMNRQRLRRWDNGMHEKNGRD